RPPLPVVSRRVLGRAHGATRAATGALARAHDPRAARRGAVPRATGLRDAPGRRPRDRVRDDAGPREGRPPAFRGPRALGTRSGAHRAGAHRAPPPASVAVR